MERDLLPEKNKNTCKAIFLPCEKYFQRWQTNIILLCSWFQCCVYTRIFRHDSTVMIRPSWFDREVTKHYSILPKISWRNQSTQSENYFDDYSLNVSPVIRKKRTVIQNLSSLSANSFSHKSRNLIVIQIYNFVGSFLNLSIRLLP